MEMIFVNSNLILMETRPRKEKAKQVIEKTATRTVQFTVRMVKLIFIILIVYTIIVSIWIFFTTGTDFLTNIATISVGGFWAFFLGYFGWRLGQSIEEYLIRITKKK